MSASVFTVDSEIVTMRGIAPSTCSTMAAISFTGATSSTRLVASDAQDEPDEQSKEITIVVPGYALLSYPLSEDTVCNNTGSRGANLRSHLENLLLYWVVTGCVLSWLAWNLSPQIHPDMWAARPRNA
jgi:hypothetical protein